MAGDVSKHRFRFSLLNLLLLTTIAVMALVIAKLAPLRDEVKRLRQRAGILLVDDESRVHAIGVETFQKKAWKWRVWCPEGKTVVVRVATAKIPKHPNGAPVVFPKHAGQLVINRRNAEAAEVEVSLAAEKNLDGTVHWNLSEGNTTMHFSVPPDAAAWLLEGSSGWTGGGVLSQTTMSPSDHPLVLLQQRNFYNQGQIPPPQPSETNDGVMAWIELQ